MAKQVEMMRNGWMRDAATRYVDIRARRLFGKHGRTAAKKIKEIALLEAIISEHYERHMKRLAVMDQRCVWG